MERTGRQRRAIRSRRAGLPFTKTLALNTGDAMDKVVGLLAAFLVFLGWIRLVGNPHVVETVIGLVLSIGVGVWIFLKMRRRNPPAK